jgi:elongation factor 1-alpha
MDVDLEKEEIKSHLKELNELKDLECINLGVDYLKLFESDLSIKNANILPKNNQLSEIRIAMLGEEAGGKSTLLGVLQSGTLDDGAGSARINVMRFPHELQNGKTLAISHQVLGFNCFEKELNYISNNKVIPTENSINSSNKNFISFYDLGGSEKAFKNTLSMISPDYIDYVFLIFSAVQGVTENTKFFLDLANCKDIPVVSIITMQDQVTSQLEMNQTSLIKSYKNLLKSSKSKKLPLLVTTQEDASLFARNLNEDIHPIFLVSNVTGYGLDLLVNFLSQLRVENFNANFSINKKIPYINDNLFKTNTNINLPQGIPQSFNNEIISQFDIHENFIKEKEGKLIIGGVVSKGQICKGSKYYLGPDKTGNFKIIQVEDIHIKKISSEIASTGQFSSLSIVKGDTMTALRPDDVRKGMSLLESSNFPKCTFAFVAEVWSLDSVNSTKTVKYKYEPLVTIKHVRQTCRVKKFSTSTKENEVEEEMNVFHMKERRNSEDFEEDTEISICSRRKNKKSMMGKDDNLSSNACYTLTHEEKTLLIFEFKNYPEFIIPGSPIIIYDGHLKAFGTVLYSI